jgi:transposase
MLLRLKIHHMAEGDVTQATIVEKTGISERSVQRILKEPYPTELELGSASSAQKRPGRPSKAEPFRERIEALFKERGADLPTTEVLRLAHSWGYLGAPSALYDLVKRLRPSKHTEPLVRFDGLPGEFAQFDFGEAKLTFADGSRQRVVFFVGRLKYSRFLHVELTDDQRAETLVRAVVACLEAFGGSPKEWVFDNPKTVRVSAPGEPIAFHPYLRDLAVEYNVLPTLCTPRTPRQKGSVENGVGFVKKNFLFARNFLDRNDLARQLAEWLRMVNVDRPCDATSEPPATRLERERPWLEKRPVRATREEHAIVTTVPITPAATFAFEGTPYSAPPARIGANATLLIRKHTLTLQLDQERCVHTRVKPTKVVQRLPEHRRDMLKLIHGQRKLNYYRRQCLLELGLEAQDFIEQLVHRYPGGTWSPVINELFELAQRYDGKVMCEAFRKAHERQQYTAEAVASILSRRAAA